MIADFETFCTWMYVVISDLEAQTPPDPATLTRPGPAAVCSDAEVLTMALVGECCGWDRETELLSQWQAHRDLFPRQPERTRFMLRFNRRRRALAERLNHLRRVLLATLDVASDPQCVIDSLPLPVVQFYHAPSASREWVMAVAAFGKCCSKKQTIFGYKLHLLITLGGVIRDFELAPANRTDVEVRAKAPTFACMSAVPRIGVKPILHEASCFDGQRPIAPVQHRYHWRCLVGFVHPASGRTIFHLASTVSIPVFEVELAALAQQVGVGPTKQIILAPDVAG